MDFSQNVVRIPIAGPEPFNTLVVVRETVSYGLRTWPGDGRVHNSPGEFRTSFVLSGFQPSADADVPFKHSTSLTTHHIDLADDTSFMSAFDGLDAGFDASGRWIVRVDGSLMSDGEWLGTYATISSWVLCREPRTERPSDDRRFQQRLGDPSSPVHAHG